MVNSMGGTIDLAAGAQNIIVAMAGANKAGRSKLISQCPLPLTGVHYIQTVVTDLCPSKISNFI
jgi:3-oxoacid CoA-transferase subunit B